jgi:protein SCO1/2
MRPFGVRWLPATIVASALALAACGTDQHELVGFPVAAAPGVAEVSLPDLTNGGEPFALRAGSGELLLVYFGYTHCPDFCPATLSNVKIARRQLDDPSQVDFAMITVDPERDLPVLADYVTGFLPDGHALGTDDAEALARAAEPFFVTYEVREVDGETEVGHTTLLYAVDDAGKVVLAWPPEVDVDDLAADLEQLLEAD